MTNKSQITRFTRLDASHKSTTNKLVKSRTISRLCLLTHSHRYWKMERLLAAKVNVDAWVQRAKLRALADSSYVRIAFS